MPSTDHRRPVSPARRMRRHDRRGAIAFVVAIATSLAASGVAFAEGAAALRLPSRGLPQDLNAFVMFMNADVIVKSIMIGLFAASVVTWTVGLVKLGEIAAAGRRERRALGALAAARTLANAQPSPGGSRVQAMIALAATEIERSDGGVADGIKERVAIALQRLEAAETRRLNRGTGILATVGAISPFVGLFGTVWGIMNSFISIAKMQTSNLAVVAPGIAEALLATAAGLAAAIPAVIIYNVLGRMIANHRATLADGSAEVMRLLSRDLDRLQAISPGDNLLALPPRHAAAAE